jgi:hypothetical protein
MILGISQPTFLPWAGYFGLLNIVDEFVFLDNIQFSKRSWQQRNKIKINNQFFFLTVPVISKNKYYQKINEVLIDKKSNFIESHKKNIEFNYKKARYFDNYVNQIFNIYDIKHDKLVDLNIDFIKTICSLLNIKFLFTRSNDLQLKSSKEKLIVDICKLKRCKTYVSTSGSKDYLKNSDEFVKNFISLKYYEFKNIQYRQLGDNYIENLSIIDLLFNLGPNTLEYIKKNFYINNEKN